MNGFGAPAGPPCYPRQRRSRKIFVGGEYWDAVAAATIAVGEREGKGR